MTHIGIMKRQPKAKSCCHAHPPHATAFAVAAVVPPTCMIPEAEVFLGQIGLAPYRTPGSPENAEIVGQMGVDHQSVLMENHGVITWGKDIEDAYWKMENTDAYCQTVLLATQLKGANLLTITGGQAKELIDLRASLGMEDKRANWKECELCDNSEFRPGVVCEIPHGAAAPSAGRGAHLDADAEAVVEAVTDQIIAQMGS
jgi:L-fuculose-phosphate aldolase